MPEASRWTSARPPAAIASAATTSAAATAKVMRMPKATVAGSDADAEAAANTAPIADAPAISPSLRDRLSMPDATPLIARAAAQAPGVRLCFTPRPDKDNAPLSDGSVASVPQHHTGRLRAGLRTFELPLALRPFTVSLLWHPRMHADPAHRWLRECVRDVCAAA